MSLNMATVPAFASYGIVMALPLMHRLRGPSAGLHCNEEHYQRRGAKSERGVQRLGRV